ncbi:hypothetical protein BCR36DRAFT_355711 [Piromyces finnis]|uniref:CCHC-type domain-containing protein n=1 Tax=Piromyces finnis TaxID=1754191 RepID=A0A1Y1V5C4_9FUNG|nr:hypothetical protein BCR36DRAFT_355711 [Piromyces finnis]|eukprot:ORX47632.1 hypothetical protein BCR36DRAFT_355711 [Piromyces finnis]
MATKILVTGSINGNFSCFFKKIKNLNKKYGPFESLFCVGDFFSDELNSEYKNLIQNQIDIDIPTYFIKGKKEFKEETFQLIEKNGGELCNNVICLGHHGVYNTSQEIKIVYLGGINSNSNQNTENEENICYYNQKDIEGLTKPYINNMDKKENLVDILLTYEWPSNITNNSQQAKILNIDNSSGQNEIATLNMELSPRYHFAASENVFFEREPFKNQAEHHTRFISLGSFGNSKKERWFYAMNISPLSKTLFETINKTPANITTTPFIDSNIQKRSLEDNDNGYFFDQSSKRVKTDGNVPPQGYVCNICNQPGHWIKNCPEAQKKKKVPESYICRICNNPGHWITDCPEKNKNKNNNLPNNYVCRICNRPGHHIRDCPENKNKRGKRIKIQEDDQCWFCLSNPNVTKHLIVSIGDESYLALAKGGLLEDGSHFLIIPITHIPCQNNLVNAPTDNDDEEVDKDALMAEMEKYKKILRDYYGSHENKKLVCFEVYGGFDGKRYRHMHIQVVPIPENIESKVEESFIADAEKNGLILSDYPTDFHEAYIRVELSNGKTLIFTKKEPNVRFNFQFGRTVLANLLNIPKRANWKHCTIPEEMEYQLTNNIKAKLQIDI